MKQPACVPIIIIAESDVIDSYRVLTTRFLADVLGMSRQDVLLTDESSLSDLCPNGIDDSKFQTLKDWKAVRAMWAPLIVQKVRSIYGIEDFSVTEPLIVTLRRIDEHEKSLKTH